MQFETIDPKELHAYIYSKYVLNNISPCVFFIQEQGSFILYNAGRIDLLEKCAKIYGREILNVIDSYYNTMLHYATEINPIISKRLINAGAALNIPGYKGNTAFHNICKNYEYIDTKYLIEDSDIHDLCNKININGITGIFIKVFKQEYDSIKYLIEYDDNIDRQDIRGNTILHYACKLDNVQIAELLVSKGANRYIKNFADLYPQDLTTNPRILCHFTAKYEENLPICSKTNKPARFYIKLPTLHYYSVEFLDDDTITCCNETYNVEDFERTKIVEFEDGKYYYDKFNDIIKNIKHDKIPIIDGVEIRTSFANITISQEYKNINVVSIINELLPTHTDKRKNIIKTLLEFNGSSNKLVHGKFSINENNNIVINNTLSIDLIQVDTFEIYMQFLTAYNMYINKIIHNNFGNLITLMSISYNILPYHNNYKVDDEVIDSFITDYYSKNENVYNLYDGTTIKIIKEGQAIYLYKKLSSISNAGVQVLENLLNSGYGINTDENVIYSLFIPISPDIESILESRLKESINEINNATIRIQTKI